MTDSLKRMSKKTYFKVWLVWLCLSSLFVILILHDNGFSKNLFILKLPTIASILGASRYGFFLIDILLLGLIPIKFFPLLSAFIAAGNIPVFFFKSLLALFSGQLVTTVIGLFLTISTIGLNITYLSIAHYLYEQFSQYRQYQYKNNYFVNWFLAVKDTGLRFMNAFFLTFLIYVLLLATVR